MGWALQGLNTGKARFSSPIWTNSGAQPASHTMGCWSFPGVKQLGHGTDHPPPFI